MSTVSSPESGEPAAPSLGLNSEPAANVETDKFPNERKFLGSLEIAKFMSEVKHPVSLSEALIVIRKPNPVNISLPVLHPSDDLVGDNKPSNEQIFIVSPLSERCSEASLQLLLSGGTLFVPKIKLLVLNDNAKGRFTILHRLGTNMTLRNFAIVQMNRKSCPAFLSAYGIKSFFHPISGDHFKDHFELCGMIHKYFYGNWEMSPASPEVHTKFGGGLARKSAASNSVNQILHAKYSIRGLSEDLKFVAEEEWKRRGSVSVETDQFFTVVKFSRIEQRDFACDSFILGFDLSGTEIGLSQIRTSKGLVLVSIENGTTTEFKHIDFKKLISPHSNIMPPPHSRLR